MIDFDLQSPRERELFADMIAELQKAGAKFEVEQLPHSHSVRIHFTKGDE